MAKVSYSKASPYSETTQESWYLGIYDPRTFTFSSNDTKMTITAEYQYRPDKLSQALYGTPEFMWVFSVRNPDILKDYIWDMVAGLEIIVPSADTINRELR